MDRRKRGCNSQTLGVWKNVVMTVTWLLGWLVGWLGGWVVGWLGGWAGGSWVVGWLVGWLVAWLLGCLVAWLLGCLVAWLLGCRGEDAEIYRQHPQTSFFAFTRQIRKTIVSIFCGGRDATPSTTASWRVASNVQSSSKVVDNFLRKTNEGRNPAIQIGRPGMLNGKNGSFRGFKSNNITT